MINREDDYTRKILNKIRNINESSNNEGIDTPKKLSDDDTTRNILNRIRVIKENNSSKNILLEENDSANGIAITDDPKFGDHVLSHQIDQFRTSVESGAEFNKPTQGNVSDAPLIYMPKTGNLIFGGIIPCLNNLRWQFVLKTSTGNGCFIWSDGMILSKDNLQILNKLFGFYKNWTEQWQSAHGDLEMLDNMFK